MAKNMRSALLEAIAADDVPTVAPVTIKRGRPAGSKNAPKTVTPTIAPTVKNNLVESVAVDGYTMLFEDSHDASEFKAAIVRNTSNPWYAVALLLASKKCATLRITRDDNVKGTPLTRIRAAITRGNQIRTDALARNVKVPVDVQYFHKLHVSQHATEKNVWLFLKLA